MEGQNAAAGDGCAREMTLYVCLGAFLEVGTAEKLCYNGGKKDCVWVENMGMVEVLRLTKEAIREGISVG